jgi:hypothetical protein
VSLTSRLDADLSLVQALVDLIPPEQRPGPITAPMLAHPVSDHYALVGTAFDYLFRFETQRRFPKSKSQTWISEEALSLLTGMDAQIQRRAKGVVSSARQDHRRFIRTPAPEPQLLGRMAEHALRLGMLDSVYRSGKFDLVFDEAGARDVRDLLHLIRIIPFNGELGRLLSKGPVLLNPTFGRYSMLVGGADADLIAGGTLIDLKVTKEPALTDLQLAQVLGYSILGERYRQNESKRFPCVTRAGLYFARHGVLVTFDLESVRSHPEYAAVGDLLLNSTRGRLGVRPALKGGEASRVRQDDIPPLTMPSPAKVRRRKTKMDETDRARASRTSSQGAQSLGQPAPPAGTPTQGPSAVPDAPVSPAADVSRALPNLGAPEGASAEADVRPSIVVKVEPVVGTPGPVVQGVTPYHAKYFAHEITRLAPGGDLDRISQSLFDACVDLQPHQIEAGLFALKSPLSKGVILADEVGLGKTIEAGLVLCQFWAERKRHLLVICPASIRKQWQQELTLKFNLPSMVLDSREYEGLRKKGVAQPFLHDKIVIVSYHYANRMKDQVEPVPWDLVVLDEAHRLRNARTQASQNLRLALRPVRKLLLTATPLQNNLGELYTLSSFIDERTFGDRESFQLQYSPKEVDLADLRKRLSPIVRRTLRKDVLEYIRYTQRHPITVTFDPDAPENTLYQEVSEFLQRNDTYSLPPRQRHLMVLLLRKILASSSTALTATLEKMRKRLMDLRGGKPTAESVEELLDDEALDEDEEEEFAETEPPATIPNIDMAKLDAEIAELTEFIELGKSIKVDS